MVEMCVQMSIRLHLECPLFLQNFKTEVVRQFPARFQILKFKKFYLASFDLLNAYRRTGGIITHYAETRTRKRSCRSHSYRLCETVMCNKMWVSRTTFQNTAPPTNEIIDY